MLAGDGFGAVSRQVLDKLKVRWEPTAAERDYNESRSTQVPISVSLRRRCIIASSSERASASGQKAAPWAWIAAPSGGGAEEGPFTRKVAARRSR